MMIFALLFVVGMLLIPVMIDARKHPNNNILRRSDRDLLELKAVGLLIRRVSPIGAERLDRAFPGAVMLTLLLGVVGILVVAYAVVFLVIALVPLLVVGIAAAFNLVFLAILAVAGKLVGNIFGYGGVVLAVLLVVVFKLVSRRSGHS